MRIETELKLGFKDVLIRPKRSTLRSRSEVDLAIIYTFCNSKVSWTGVPIMASNMDKTGTFSMASALAEFQLMTCLHKHYTILEWRKFFSQKLKENIWSSIVVSCGTSDEDFNKTKNLFQIFPKLSAVCIDVANGYSEHFVDYIKKMRDHFPNKIIIAGNVATGEMTEQLILSGADIVKVGIGPGSVCTTRLKTGVGYPQLSAIIECADAAHGLRGHIISDGGCTHPGDLAKAFGAGADFVMLGGMLAGHKESESKIKKIAGKKYCNFYGMSSATAMKAYAGGVADYRSSEGKSVLVPYKGEVKETIKDILGGLRSSCTYVGASRLKDLSKKTTFIRVAEQENKFFS